MENVHCSVNTTYHQRSDAEYCLNQIEQKTKKPHRIYAQSIILDGTTETQWSVKEHPNCREGVVYEERYRGMSTFDQAEECSASLERIEGGSSKFEPQLVKTTGIFESDHYRVIRRVNR